MFQKKIQDMHRIIQGIQSDITTAQISDFLSWFSEKLLIHFKKQTPKLKFQKGDIFFVNLGKNVGSELNKIRPCVIYSIRSYNSISGAIIIPLKSCKNKNPIEKYQILVTKNDQNGLDKDSLIDIFYIQNISSKRLNKKIGKLNPHILEQIDVKIVKMFGIKNKE